VGEQGVQEGTKHSSLRCPVSRVSVADMLLPTLSTLGAARQEVQDPVAEGAVQSRGTVA
jgi:hypothetical protein